MPKLLTIFVVRSKDRPTSWFNKCLYSLQHDDIDVQVIEGTATLPELLQLRLTLPALAKTKYMAFVDDDDWIAPEHIVPMLNIMETGVWGGIYSNETLVSPTGRVLSSRDSIMTKFDPMIHHKRLIDTHHLTIVDSELARKAAEFIPKTSIFLEPLLYGFVGLMAPLVHYPHKAYFWRRPSVTASEEKRRIHSIATLNASKLYLTAITHGLNNRLSKVMAQLP